MKYFLLLLLATFISLTSQAQFRIKVTAKNTADSIVYVRTSVYDDQNYVPKDTISLRKSGWKVSKKAIIGGIGFLYFPKTKSKIWICLDNNDSLSVSLSGPDYLASIQTKDKKNKLFFEYQRMERSLAFIDTLYKKEQANGRKFSYSERAAFFKMKSDSLTKFRTQALKRLKPTDALSIHFKSLNALDRSIPDRKNYAKRAAFLNEIPFNNPKYLFTPNFKATLTEYMSYYPLQADSMQVGMDLVLGKFNCDAKAYPYAFDFFARLMKNRNIQNNTEGYVYFLTRYVKQSGCKFLPEKRKMEFLQELDGLSGLPLNQLSPALNLADTTGKSVDLHSFAKDYDYTLLVFYAPTCEHCQKEVPEVEKVLKMAESVLQLKIGRYAICNEPGVPDATWKEFIAKYNLKENYAHVTMPGITKERLVYDALSNPVFYLLDKQGNIVGKKLGAVTIRKFFGAKQSGR
jgi:thiol-disulfide isomerase/thioredoxin